MLRIKKLQFGFKDKPIFHDLDLRFEKSYIIGLVGRNGIGKTTLFRVMTGYLTADSGSMEYNNKSLDNELIGFLPTEPYFYPHMKGEEYIKIVLDNDGQIQDNLKYGKQLNLPLNNLVDTYSTGMRKKLAFSSVISQNRPIQIFDEPFNGVDLEGNEIIQYMIKKNKPNKITIISSHILSTLTELCDAIYYIHENFETQLFQKNEFVLLENMVKREMRKEIGV